MNKTKDLQIGNWMPTENDEFTVKTDKDTYYSSKNQDSIMILSELIKLRKANMEKQER